MRHRATIIATIVALLFGSLGLPAAVHACGMKADVVELGSSCSMCAAAERDAADCKTPTKQKRSKKTCCTTSIVTRHLDPAVPFAAATLVVPVFILLPFVCYPLFAAIAHVDVDSVIDRPPPTLAQLGRYSWLRLERILI